MNIKNLLSPINTANNREQLAFFSTLTLFYRLQDNKTNNTIQLKLELADWFYLKYLESNGTGFPIVHTAIN